MHGIVCTVCTITLLPQYKTYIITIIINNNTDAENN
jgi:hypothetical protein